jgi:O-6-methylguanine DNA methyltransferase
VLRKALEIPRGEVRPYAWIAREIGRPKAVRAVGSTLANNPVPLLIPCHRVVRSDGSIGQYGLGPENKRGMLEAEGVNPVELEELARRGIRYFGSDTTRIYCFPTCGHARRIRAQHRLLFHSEGEAAAAGFQPCKICRPGAIAVGA